MMSVAGLSRLPRRLRLLHERIRAALHPNRRRRTVTGQDGDVVAEREKFLPDPVKQQIAIATGQIPSADAAGEQNVAADQQFIFSGKETKTARAMTRNFQNFHFEPEEIAGGSRFDQEIGFDRFDLELKADAAEKFRVGNHRDGFGMATDRATEPVLDFRQVGNVIEMAVGQEEQLRGYAFGGEPIAGAIGSVEENRSLRGFEEITVRLEDAATKGFVSHRVDANRDQRSRLQRERKLHAKARPLAVL